MRNTITHTFVGIVTVVLLLLLTDPFMYWMPEQMVMAVLAGASVLMCFWMGFVAYERAADEREVQHRMFTGRVAYLAGIAVLTVALLVQGLAHSIDPWIATALAVMVLAKLLAHAYISRNN